MTGKQVRIEEFCAYSWTLISRHYIKRLCVGIDEMLLAVFSFAPILTLLYLYPRQLIIKMRVLHGRCAGWS